MRPTRGSLAGLGAASIATLALAGAISTGATTSGQAAEALRNASSAVERAFNQGPTTPAPRGDSRVGWWGSGNWRRPRQPCGKRRRWSVAQDRRNAVKRRGVQRNRKAHK